MLPTQRFRSSRTEPPSVDLEHLESSLERVRRPRTSVHSIIVANTVNANNQWIQLQLTRGSWVLMQPRRRKHSTSKSIFISAWKGRIKDFKIEVGKTTVKEVLVQHVYMHKELALSKDQQSCLPTHRLHFVYPSSYEEWQPVECIIGIMNVVHSHIGQLQYEGRSSKSLADAGIFFYDHFYCLLDRNKRKGYLQQLPLHTEWNYLDWPIPDHFTIESVKSKLFKDIQKSLRGSIPTRVVKIIIYMPIIVFVELFHCCEVRITKTMRAGNLKSTFLENLFDEGWSKRVHDQIHCNIVFHTVNFKYMIATQTFIMSFWYKRSRYIKGELIPLDQEAASLENDKVIHIEVFDTEFRLITDIALRESSSLQELRQDILDECPEPYPSKFLFYHNGRKVLPRREKRILCKDLQNKVQLISA